MKKRVFTILIEKGENGAYIAEVPGLKGCNTQGGAVEDAMKNIKETTDTCLEEQDVIPNEFAEVQKIGA
ncbi:MAG: type II toxin-antitoxin system HicB family antitoxin [Candidatus Aenigmarchaeota archaeon]|nr:type II toxin-antitoxin system HicB family antitoxin [Candidatus Aenigmarchaeota archaeon]